MRSHITRERCVMCGCDIAASNDSTGVLRLHRHSAPDTRGQYCEGSGSQPATDELIEATRALGPLVNRAWKQGQREEMERAA